jgi:hypothetical protein
MSTVYSTVNFDVALGVTFSVLFEVSSHGSIISVFSESFGATYGSSLVTPSV